MRPSSPPFTLEAAMANFAGIPPLRVILRLHGRVLPVQLAKRGGVVCSARRDYGSPFPVKYVPKKASASSKEERPSPIKRPKENDVRRTGRSGKSFADRGELDKVVLSNNGLRDSINRWNSMNGLVVDSSLSERGVIESQTEVSVDSGIMESSCWEIEDEMNYDQEAQDDRLMKGAAEFLEEIEPDKKNIHKQDVLCNDRTRKDAEELAIKLLARRAYTAVEMKKKLHQKRFAAALVDSVIDDFQRRGLINDTLYAETFSQSRWSSSSWGPGRIKLELLRKGISRVDVDKAVRQVFESDVDGTTDMGSRLVLSRDALDRLFVQALKQWHRSQGVPPETRKSRILRWLQYRGFNWGVTSLILKRLESQESS